MPATIASTPITKENTIVSATKIRARRVHLATTSASAPVAAFAAVPSAALPCMPQAAVRAGSRLVRKLHQARHTHLAEYYTIKFRAVNMGSALPWLCWIAQWQRCHAARRPTAHSWLPYEPSPTCQLHPTMHPKPCRRRYAELTVPIAVCKLSCTWCTGLLLHHHNKPRCDA
jgi:hypothetical protein